MNNLNRYLTRKWIKIHNWLIIINKKLLYWMSAHDEWLTVKILLCIWYYYVDIAGLSWLNKNVVSKCIIKLRGRRYLRFINRMWHAIRSKGYVIIVVLLLALMVSLLGLLLNESHNLVDGMWEMRGFIMSSAVVVILLDFIQEERRRNANLQWQYWTFHAGFHYMTMLYSCVFPGTVSISLYRSKEQRGIYEKAIYNYPLDADDIPLSIDELNQFYFLELRKVLENVLQNKERLALNDAEVQDVIELTTRCLDKMSADNPTDKIQLRSMWLGLFHPMTTLFLYLSRPWSLPYDLHLNAEKNAIKNNYEISNGMLEKLNTNSDLYTFTRKGKYMCKVGSKTDEMLTKEDVAIYAYEIIGRLVFYDEKKHVLMLAD